MRASSKDNKPMRQGVLRSWSVLQPASKESYLFGQVGPVCLTGALWRYILHRAPWRVSRDDTQPWARFPEVSRLTSMYS